MRQTLSAHGRCAVLCGWLTALSWSLPAAAQALADSSLSNGLRGYDFESVAWGVLVAAVGGFGATVVSLLSPNVVVIDVLRETWKDLLIAAVAGAAATVLLMAAQSAGAAIAVPIQVAILAACGWARMGFFVWAGRSVKTLADRGTQWAADKISKPAESYEQSAPPMPWRDAPDAQIDVEKGKLR
jgi:hypothetical protein